MKTSSSSRGSDQSILSIGYRHFVLCLMVCAILLVGVILPFKSLLFYQAYPLTQLGSWLLLPTRLLFPGRTIIYPLPPPPHAPPPAPLPVSWEEAGMLFVSFLVLWISYLLAMRFLSRYVTYRYILLSTLLLGVIYVFFPITTSQDVFSYIAYARMGVIYHLNPLTALPTDIRRDTIYPYLFWVHQPSAYGPTWVIITCALQWISLIFGSQHIFPMVLLLRFFGLAMHLGSIYLIWRLSGHLQQASNSISSRIRLAALLAFAWNPFLLFEACVNAHIDTSILFFILLALWFLQPGKQGTGNRYLLAAALLAVVACLKVTFVLLMPGLLLFLWTQQAHRLRTVLFAGATYIGIVLLLYAPFWQQGLLHLFQISPATSRVLNSPYEFLLRLIESIKGKPVLSLSADIGSRPEVITHWISMGIFLIVYGLLCLWPLIAPRSINTLPSLIRWMALCWLLYSLLGSSWFWPWYIIAFFGLATLLTTSTDDALLLSFLRLPLALCLLTFSMLGLYCFYTWAPHASTIPYLPYFQWAYLRGLWIWLFLFPSANLSSFLQRRKEKRSGSNVHPTVLSMRPGEKVGT